MTSLTNGKSWLKNAYHSFFSIFKNKVFRTFLILGMFCFSVIYWIASKPKHDLEFTNSSEVLALDFTVKNLKGQDIALSSFKGKPILLNFWATWCPPCVEEFPDLVEFSKWASEKLGLVVVAVSTDKSPQDVIKFLEKKKIFSETENPITILSSPDSAAALKYGTEKYPETFFINADFKLVKKFVGIQKWNSEEMKKWVLDQK